MTARADQRGTIYRDTTNRLRFNSILADVVNRCTWRVHAWCQMTNHYHLLVETPKANLSDGMRQLNGSYANYFNRAHSLVGHVFQGRYSAINVQIESHLLELARYVVLNPVRANMVPRVEDWPWSSHRETVGMKVAEAWLTTDAILRLFGNRREVAVSRYVQFVAAGMNAKSPWEKLRYGICLGDDDFVNSILGTIDPSKPLDEIPNRQYQPRPQSLGDWLKKSPDRNAAIAGAYLAGGYTQSQIGSFFGLHYSRVSRIIRNFRDRQAKGKT